MQKNENFESTSKFKINYDDSCFFYFGFLTSRTVLKFVISDVNVHRENNPSDIRLVKDDVASEWILNWDMKDKIISRTMSDFIQSKSVKSNDVTYRKHTHIHIWLWQNVSAILLSTFFIMSNDISKKSVNEIKWSSSIIHVGSKSSVSRDTFWFGKKDKHMGAMSCDELFDDYVKKRKKICISRRT